MTQTLRVARLDFLTIRQYLGIRQLGFFLLLAFVLCYMNGTSSFSIGILMMYGLFYTAYPFAIGEKTKIDLLYASLPLQTRNLVFGRYLFALLINLGSGLIAFLFTFATALVLRQDFVLEETVAAIVGCFFLFTLVEAIQMPFYFKLGYTKAKLVVFLPLVVVPAVSFWSISDGTRAGPSWLYHRFWKSSVSESLAPGALLSCGVGPLYGNLTSLFLTELPKARVLRSDRIKARNGHSHGCARWFSLPLICHHQSLQRSVGWAGAEQKDGIRYPGLHAQVQDRQFLHRGCGLH